MKKRKILILSFLILIVLVLTHQVDRIDQLIYEKIQLIQTPLLTQIMIYLTNLGSGIFYAFVLILCFLFKRKQTASLTLFLFCCCMGTADSCDLFYLMLSDTSGYCHRQLLHLLC